MNKHKQAAGGVLGRRAIRTMRWRGQGSRTGSCAEVTLSRAPWAGVRGEPGEWLGRGAASAQALNGVSG